MLLVGLAAFAIALATSPLVLAGFGRAGVVDLPSERSSHDRPVIRGGGLAPAVACIAAAAIALRNASGQNLGLGVALAAVLYGVIGIAEDVRGISPLSRFLLQLAAAGAVSPWLLRELTGHPAWRLLFGLGALFWLVAYVNAFNFMDGINGISAVQSVIVGTTWALLGQWHDVDTLAWGGATLAGACLGFLPFNFPTARIFLGDVGSYFLGGWQAALLIVGIRAGLPPEAVGAPLIVYVADTGLTLLRRAMRGETWYLPHRQHIYQRVVLAGWSHVQTTLVVTLMVVISALLGLLSFSSSWLRGLADVGLAALVISYVALPRLVTRRSLQAR